MLKKTLLLMVMGISILGVGCGTSKAPSSDIAPVEEAKEPIKIVSSTVAATQVMDKLELDLVGVPTTKTTLPERYKDVQDVGQAFEPNFEVIASLDPDLLVFDNNFKEKVEAQVNQFGMNAYYFDTSTFTAFRNSITELGELTDSEDKALELSKTLQKSVDDVLAKGEELSKVPTVAIIFGTSESFMLATDKSYVGDLLDTIGAVNVTDGLEAVDSAYLNFSMEQILQMNPDYVLRMSHGDLETSKKAFDDAFANDPAWKSLDATKEGRVIDLDPTIFGVTANLGVTNAITELGNIIYGK